MNEHIHKSMERWRNFDWNKNKNPFGGLHFLHFQSELNQKNI